MKTVQPVQVIGSTEKDTTGVSIDSRLVVAGYLFMAIRGMQADEYAYIPATIEKSAIAVSRGDMPEEPTPNTMCIQVKDSENAVGKVVTVFYGDPISKIELMGVTGTGSETTAAILSHDMFRHFGYRVGLISTVCNYIDDRATPTEHTTLNPITLDRLLSEMADPGCKYAFMEISSHSIVQQCISGLKSIDSIFTNLTHDHLNYHKTVENYLKAKKKFFDNMSKDTSNLTNLDDKNDLAMTQDIRSRVYTYPLRSLSGFKGRILESHSEGMLLDFNNCEPAVRFIGKFNAYNLLAVFDAAVLLDKKGEDALIVLGTLHPTAGRFDSIRFPRGATAIVDYTHILDTLINVLNAIHDVLRGKRKVIAVVGADGSRDRGKHPTVAKESARLNDRVIIIPNNPRSGEPQDIIDDMLARLDKDDMRKTISITDKKEAIETTYVLVQPGDVILAVGKGYEDYQEIKRAKHHSDDKEIIKEIMN